MSEGSYHYVVPIENVAKRIATMPVVREKEPKPSKKRKGQSQNVLNTTVASSLRLQRKVGLLSKRGVYGRTTRQVYAPITSVGVGLGKPLSSSTVLVDETCTLFNGYVRYT